MSKEKQIFYKVDSPTFLKERFKVRAEGFYSKPDKWFETEQEAMTHFTAARTTALEKADEILRELSLLQKKLGFYISYTMEGDTYGIYNDYQYIGIKVAGYEFMLKYNPP